MQKTLETTLITAALCLGTAALAAAQDTQCTDDADCPEGMRCASGLVLASCPEPPCEGEGEPVPGSCVDALLGEPCMDDGDCGGELTCARMLVDNACANGDPECVPEPIGEGYCADNASLAASSGLAPGGPEPAAAMDGAAGGSAGPATGTPEAPESGDMPSSGGGSSSCSIGGQTGGIAGWAAPLMALAALALRRRRGARA